MGVNVLVLMVDQMRWDCLGCVEGSEVMTPNLDALAADGTWFANAFCPAPICAPSRYSLLSGLEPRQHLAVSNRSTLAGGVPTFPKILRAMGYRTQAIGKMHLTPTYLDVGFDRMQLAEQDGDGRFDDDYHRDLMDHGLLDAVDLYDQRAEYRRRAPARYWSSFGSEPSDLPEEWHSTSWIGARAAESLAGWAPESELLMVSFIKPHHPFDPPAPWDSKYDPASLRLLPGWRDSLDPLDEEFDAGYYGHRRLSEGALRQVMAGYFGNISHVDHQIGILLRTLRERGLYDRTLVVFTGDHGEYLGFRHMIAKSNRMYEPLVRVPLVVKLPGDRGRAAVRDDLVSLLDVMPTILAQAGAPVPPGPGRDLWALPAVPREAVFASSAQGERMVRTKDAKLLVTRRSELLFDLASDPLETVDRASDPALASTAADLRELLRSWALWESEPPPYCNEGEPAINAPNVPSDIPGQRDRARRYFDAHFPF